jgi:predicted transposase YdaD
MATTTYPYVSHLRSQGREEGRQEGLQEGREEGREEGRAEAIVQVLEARHIELSDADRERILGCRESDTLTAWLGRAALIASISELFAPLPA